MPNNDNNCVKEHLKFSVVLSHRTTGYTASTCFSIQSSLPSYPNAKPFIVHRKIWAPWLFLLIYPLITKLWQTLIWLIIEFCFKIVFVKQIYDFQHCIKSSYFVQGESYSSWQHTVLSASNIETLSPCKAFPSYRALCSKLQNS